MGVNLRQISRTVASNNGASRHSEPVRISGNPFGVHVYAPAANLVDIEISEDLGDWESATDARDPAAGDLLEQLENERRDALERPKWARFEVRSDAGGPRDFTVVFVIRREDH